MASKLIINDLLGVLIKEPLQSKYDWSTKEGRSLWETDFDMKYLSRKIQVMNQFAFQFFIHYFSVFGVMIFPVLYQIGLFIFQERQEFFDRCEDILCNDESIGIQIFAYVSCFTLAILIVIINFAEDNMKQHFGLLPSLKKTAIINLN